MRTSPTRSPGPDGVRREGRGRRGLLLASAGAALLAVAVAVPLSLSGDGEGGPESAGPSPPARPWRTSPSAGFPLSEGLTDARTVRVGAGSDLTSFPACRGVAAWTTALTTSLTAVRAGQPGRGAGAQDELAQTRVLAVYPDDSAAATALDRAGDAVGRCDARRVPQGTLLPLPLDGGGGEASYAFVDPAESGWVVTELTRVGNALLIDRATAPALPVPSGADPLQVSGQVQADRMWRRAAGVVSAMCSFAAVPCPTGDPAPAGAP